MCKGDIIEEYIKERREQGVVYDFTAYSGDGKNDLCPTLRLSENDLAFPRCEIYALLRYTYDQKGGL